MRLFVALDIDDAQRERLLGFARQAREVSPQLRWVRPESWHVTLKFLGEIPQSTLDDLIRTLLGLRCEAVDLTFEGYGFLPPTRYWNVLSIAVNPNPRLVRLAQAIDRALAAPGVAPNGQRFRPHLTLARRRRERGGGDGNCTLEALREKLKCLPRLEFGTLGVREFWLYQSEPGASGSQYTKLARFALV
jgi:2'-5' RNA ligase